MTDIAIRVENLSKRRPSATLRISTAFRPSATLRASIPPTPLRYGVLARSRSRDRTGPSATLRASIPPTPLSFDCAHTVQTRQCQEGPSVLTLSRHDSVRRMLRDASRRYGVLAQSCPRDRPSRIGGRHAARRYNTLRDRLASALRGGAASTAQEETGG